MLLMPLVHDAHIRCCWATKQSVLPARVPGRAGHCCRATAQAPHLAVVQPVEQRLLQHQGHNGGQPLGADAMLGVPAEFTAQQLSSGCASAASNPPSALQGQLKCTHCSCMGSLPEGLPKQQQHTAHCPLGTAFYLSCCFTLEKLTTWRAGQTSTQPDSTGRKARPASPPPPAFLLFPLAHLAASSATSMGMRGSTSDMSCCRPRSRARWKGSLRKVLRTAMGWAHRQAGR